MGVASLSLAALTLSLIGLAACILWSFPYEGMRWSPRTGYVAWVDPRGPAAVAGVRAADRIITVDGLPVRRAHVAYPQKRVGDAIRFVLERRGQARVARVTRAAPPAGARAVRLGPLLIGLVFWLAGLLAWAAWPSGAPTAVFLLFSQVTAATLTAGSLRGTLLSPAVTLFAALFPLVPPLAVHLVVLCSPRPPRRWRRWLLSAAYGVHGLLALGVLTATRPPADPLPPDALWRAYQAAAAVTLTAALALTLRGWRAPGPETRRRRWLLATGVGAGLFPLVAFGLLPHLLRLPGQGGVRTYPSLALVPFCFTYALGPASGRAVPSRRLRCTLLTLPLAGLSFALLLALRPLLRPTSGRLLALNVGTILAVAALVYALRLLLQPWADRILYGGWPDYRAAIRETGQRLGHALDPDSLAAWLLSVARTMRFDAAAVLWPEAEALVPRASFGFPAQDLGRLAFPVGPGLAANLTATPELRAAEAMAATPAALKEAAPLRVEGARWWLPLVSRATLRGVVVLGCQRGEEELDPEDRDLLTALGVQAAIAADNIALFQILRAQLAQLQLAHDEVAEVRRRLAEGTESERQRLARELHDGPLQELEAMCLALGPPGPASQESDRPPAREAMADRLVSVIDGLRAVCRDLRPPALAPFGLAAAIRSDAERFAEAHPQVQVRLDLAADGQRLPEEVRLALCRIYREAMRNVERHAQASQVSIRLDLEREQVSLEVRDNGRGFQVPDRWVRLARDGHMGLLGAAERAAAIGGRLEVESTAGCGTSVRAVAPAGKARGTS